jgi:hypothetical protein
VATRAEYRWPHFLGASLLMGGGICAMHYLGMLAIEMSIPIAWDWPLVAASALIAVLASATALTLFRALFSLSGKRLWLFQTLAALVMGFAICGMHYTGMSAASFASGSVCLSAEALSGPELTTIIIITTVMLLIAAMFSTLLDARLQSTAFKLNQSLQEANAKLQLANTELRQRAFADPLTNLPNRLLFEDRLIHALLRLERQPITNQGAAGNLVCGSGRLQAHQRLLRSCSRRPDPRQRGRAPHGGSPQQRYRGPRGRG